MQERVAEIVQRWKSYTCFSADYLNEWMNPPNHIQNSDDISWRGSYAVTGTVTGSVTWKRNCNLHYLTVILTEHMVIDSCVWRVFYLWLFVADDRTLPHHRTWLHITAARQRLWRQIHQQQRCLATNTTTRCTSLLLGNNCDIRFTNNNAAYQPARQHTARHRC